MTFLNVSVYVASFYIDSDIVSSLRASALWNKFTAATFQGTEGQWFARDLVRKHKGDMSLTVLPVRNTNGAHLRTGFIKNYKSLLNKEKSYLSAEQVAVSDVLI